MKRGIAALLLAALVGCGGSVETAATGGGGGGGGAGSPCDVPTEPFDSGRAIALARCHVPAQAKLVHLSSSNVGALDPQGRDASWTLIFWDEAAKTRYFGGVMVNQGASFAPDDISLTCGTGELTPVDGPFVVADAITRYAPHDLHPDSHRNYFLWESLPCIDDTSEERHRVFISDLDPSLPNDEATKQPHIWVVDYDASSNFVRLCGPCQNPSAACEPCEP